MYAQAFVVAFRIPNMLRDLIGEGATNAAFVPVLSEYLETKKREEFWHLANVLLNVILIMLSVVSLLGITGFTRTHLSNPFHLMPRLATRLNRGLVGTLFPILNGADVHGTLLCRGTVLPQLLRRCVTGRDVFKVELLVMALRNGCRLETVPLPTRENRSARSGLSGRSLRYLTDLLRFWCQGSTY